MKPGRIFHEKSVLPGGEAGGKRDVGVERGECVCALLEWKKFTSRLEVMFSCHLALDGFCSASGV